MPENKIKPFSHEDNFVFRWRGPEYLKYQKGALWYICAGGVLGLFFLYAYWQSSFLLAFVAILMAAVYAHFDFKNPEEVDVIISEMGIKIGKREILFDSLDCFRIEHQPPLHMLYVVTKGAIKHEIGTPYPIELNPADLEKYLKTHLRKQHLSERKLLDTLLRLLKI